jgi:hypothetical protein
MKTMFSHVSRAVCAAAAVATLASTLHAQSQDFVAIFDGKTLTNWDGDPAFWRVENGAIVGESTPEKRVTQNTFLIWRGGTTADFELKIEYRISGGAGSNSGVQYRSSVLENVGKWAMKGYQADIDGANRYSGQIYEERGRGFMAMRGAFTRIAGASAAEKTPIGSFGSDSALKALLKPDDWNSLHIIARGGTITQIVNGRVMSAIVDEDVKGRSLEGLLGLQIHTGPPMKIEFRSVMLRKL